MNKFKYISGSGNSFYIGDELNINSDLEVIAYVADSTHEIDGVISLTIDIDKKNTLNMEYFNSDGSKAELCVNGVRCAAKYAYDNKYFSDPKIFVNTPTGIIETEIEDNDVVSSLIRYPKFPDNLTYHEILGYKGVIVDVGNPHFVIISDNIEAIDIEEIGTKFQDIELFKNGTNVEFCNIIDKNNVIARVYERGVGETSACGSGAAAIFYSLFIKDLVSDNISINYPGGNLKLKIKNDKIYISGEIRYL